MNNETWNQWLNNFEWILTVCKIRGWNYDELQIKPPINREQIERLEEELEIEYPDDFKEVLINYSSALHLYWDMNEERAEGIYYDVFSGGGRGYLWDFTQLKADYHDYLGWVKECFPNPEDEYDKVWHNKIPFIDVPNGDMIAFGKKEENGHPVIYLSHDDSEYHGYRLAENFVEFVTRWSNVGCPGTEDWQIIPFYDHENKKIKCSGEEVENWKKWLMKL